MRDFDHTKVKPGDRFRVTEKVAPTDELGKEITVASIAPGIFGFYATDGFGYGWGQVEPIEPALITRPIEGMPDWLANTKKGEAVKCSAWQNSQVPHIQEVWIIGMTDSGHFVSSGYGQYDIAEPWIEPDEEPKPEEKLYTKAEVLEAIEKALKERSKQ